METIDGLSFNISKDDNDMNTLEVIVSEEVYKKEIDIPRFLGVYLSSDLPLLLLLPFSLLTLLLPSIGGLVGFMSFVLGILVWWYKILVISESFNIPSSKAILLTILPFILMTIWIVTSAITVFNYSVTFF